MTRYVKQWLGSACVIAACSTLWGAEPPNLVPNPSFEEAREGKPVAWRIGGSMSRWVDDRAATGTHSLLIEDTSKKDGSNVSSARMAVCRHA